MLGQVFTALGPHVWELWWIPCTEMEVLITEQNEVGLESKRRHWRKCMSAPVSALLLPGFTEAI